MCIIKGRIKITRKCRRSRDFRMEVAEILLSFDVP
jgi:hypothetical protein